MRREDWVEPKKKKKKKETKLTAQISPSARLGGVRTDIQALRGRRTVEMAWPLTQSSWAQHASAASCFLWRLEFFATSISDSWLGFPLLFPNRGLVILWK